MTLNFTMPQAYTKPLQILKASAGSGKTFNLTIRFLILLFSGENKYRKIMAVTFTNKATAEMKQRIMTVLEHLARGEWEEVQPYWEEIHRELPELDKETAQQKASYIYKQILHDYGRLTITTIDKFVQQIIRSFTYELGIDADYQITLNTKQVAEDLSKRLHHSLDEKPELLEWIIARAKQQIREGKRWDYQGELDKLSKKIFSEDFQAFDQAIKEKDSNVLFHEMQEKINTIKEEFEKDLESRYKLLQETYLKVNPDTSDLYGKSKNVLKRLEGSFEDFLGYLIRNSADRLKKLIDSPEEWFQKTASASLHHLYTLLNPMLINFVRSFDEGMALKILAEALEKNLYYLRLMKEMSELLKEYRAENSILLISDATRLLKGITSGMEENPSFIWEKVGNRYHHFLFDEFQDTSHNQWDNFKPLVKNAIASGTGEKTEHLVVGDVKQSIYRWRGGDWNILLNGVEQDLGKSFVAVDSLQTNYRSEEHILTFNNYVFPFLADWLQNKINSDIESVEEPGFMEQMWNKNNFHTIIREAYADVQQRLPEGKAKGKGIVDWKVFPVDRNQGRRRDTEEATLQYTADTLYRWIEEEKRYRSGQIGILVRTTGEAKALIRFFEKDLLTRANKKAYRCISGGALRLDENPAVQLLIEALKWMTETKDNKHIHLAACAYFYGLFKNDSPLTAEDWLKIGRRDSSAPEAFLPADLRKDQERLRELPLPELIEELLSIFDLSTQEESLSYLFALRDYVAEFIEGGGFGVRDFLDWWENEEEKSLPSSEGYDAVQIMTIHKAKGLAFDVVMLPFLSWAFAPKSREQFWVQMHGTPFEEMGLSPLEFQKSLQHSVVKPAYYRELLYAYMDSLNLLYVAMTRPRKHLWLCMPGYSPKTGIPSSFGVGDVLQEALSHYEAEHNRSLLFPEEPAGGPAKRSDEETAYFWSFVRYPIAHHLKKQLDEETKNKLERLDNEENIRIGTAVHALLALCHMPEQVEAALDKLFEEGWFSLQERKKISRTARNVLENPGLRNLLDFPGQFLDEREIIDKAGRIYRPDKVLTGKDKTIILDYKFGNEHEAHFEQVRNYKVLLEEMSYPGVEGYLFYGFPGKLIKV